MPSAKLIIVCAFLQTEVKTARSLHNMGSDSTEDLDAEPSKGTKVRVKPASNKVAPTSAGAGAGSGNGSTKRISGRPFSNGDDEPTDAEPPTEAEPPTAAQTVSQPAQGIVIKPASGGATIIARTSAQ